MLQLMVIQFCPKQNGVCFQEDREDVPDNQIQSPTQNYWTVSNLSGDHSSTVDTVLCYKSEGRQFDPRWCHWNFSLT